MKLIEAILLPYYGRVLWKSTPSEMSSAEENILHGIGMLEEMQIRPYYSQGYLFLGELYADTRQKEKALENLKKAEANFQEMGMDYWQNKTQEVLDRI